MTLEYKCEFCNKNYLSFGGLYKHLKNKHPDEYIIGKHICKFCNKEFENLNKLRGHVPVCDLNTNKQKNIEKRAKANKHRWSSEERKHLSEIRKKFLKEHPDEHPWKKNTKFVSVPCEKLKERLKQEGFVFEEEYTDTRWKHNFSLDIAFLNKQFAIEINGNQHYNNDGTLTKYYQKRHDYLVSEGWKILEIHYANCFKEDKILEIIDAIKTNEEIDLTEHKLLFENKAKSKEEKRLARTIKLNNAKEKGLINSKGWICSKIITEEIWLERRALIENSGIDITKFGWVEKMIKVINLTRHVIKDTVYHFEDLKAKAFYRKGSLANPK